jgi:hypothetical protein
LNPQNTPLRYATENDNAIHRAALTLITQNAELHIRVRVRVRTARNTYAVFILMLHVLCIMQNLINIIHSTGKQKFIKEGKTSCFRFLVTESLEL